MVNGQKAEGPLNRGVAKLWENPGANPASGRNKGQEVCTATDNIIGYSRAILSYDETWGLEAVGTCTVMQVPIKRRTQSPFDV